MHELAYPPAIDLPIADTLASIPATRAADFPDSPMYALRTEGGWQDVTARGPHPPPDGSTTLTPWQRCRAASRRSRVRSTPAPPLSRTP
jgi:hypothetical protein